MLTPLRVVPFPSERPWGGRRLMPPRTLPIGELWLAGPWLQVASGRHAGLTLEEVATEMGPDLVGSAASGRPGPRFPLLAKLIDPADWVSVQVHPDDEVARALEGPDAVGKVEAWYVVEAEPGAELFVGVRPGVSLDEVRAAMRLPAERRGGAVVDLLARLTVGRGDTITLPAGTLHAIGPGPLLYEIQQPSDVTYRVDDWGRPATAERPLHLAQALAALGVGGSPEISRAVPAGRIAACGHFTLDLVERPEQLAPGGLTVHVVTALDGPARLCGAGWTEELAARETAVVPASVGTYDVVTLASRRVLVAGLP